MAADEAPASSLAEARAQFHTQLEPTQHPHTPPPEPPAELYRLVHYPAPVGELAAYLTPAVEGPPKPALLWLPGDFHAGLDAKAWEPSSRPTMPEPGIYQAAGVVLMVPSLRGGNDNPGQVEGFYGEVDDVLAAAEYLMALPGVDARRVHLAGHSTGGTLALLVAETGATLFQTIIALGPRHDVASYPRDRLPFPVEDEAECAVRSPVRWLESIWTPTWILEGDHRSNLRSWHVLAEAPHTEAVRFQVVPHADHFSLVRPFARLLAGKIVEAPAAVAFTPAELGTLVP